MQQHTLLVFVFLFGLILKASFAAGVDAPNTGPQAQPATQAQATSVSVTPATAPAAAPTVTPAAAPAASASASTTITATPADSAVKQMPSTTVPDNATRVLYNNNITVQPPLATPAAPQVAYRGDEDAAAVLGTREHAYASTGNAKSVAIMPMVGGSGYMGNWNGHVNNNYNLGLILEVPVSQRFSLELEGGRGEYKVGYSYFVHNFNMWDIAGNGKVYIPFGIFRPYVGAGVMGLYYENMSRGPLYGYSYNQWLGAGQLLAGAEIAATDDVSFGVRGTWAVPLFNKAVTADNGYVSYPGYEEASLMNSSFYRVMGTVRVAF